MMKRKRRKLWAMFMAAALVVTLLPAVAMAEDDVPEDKVNFAAGEREDGLGHGSIASFEPLPGGVAEQTVDVGTELSALNLPDTVTATIYHVTEDALIEDEDAVEDDSVDSSTASSSNADESASGTSGEDSYEKGGGGTVTTVTTTEEEIPVTWGDGEPAYDSDTEGRYVFTADVGGYVLSGGAELPQITVDVVAKVMRNGVMPPISGTLEKTITGWSFVDADFLSGDELALPGVNMDNQADFDTVVSMLPTQISGAVDKVNGSGAASVTLDITWSCPEYKKDDEGNWPLTGEYTFTAELPEGYVCNQPPTIKVLIGGASLYSNEYDGLTITGGTVKAETDGQIRLTEDGGDYVISGTWNGTLSGVVSSNRKAVITVQSGVTANVMLRDLTIDVSGTDYAIAFAVEANGTANITLQGTSKLDSGWGCAGLKVPENAQITIDGFGSLTATGGNSGAGIGENASGSSGTIEISGGTVTANSGVGCAGIGGGIVGIIKVSDGTVNAISHNGAGIGGSATHDGGTIEISGGTVTASSNYGAGIGGGGGIGSGGSGGIIKISGGTVTASSNYGAGIGGGNSDAGKGGSGGDIEISGGTVIASSDRGAGIGGGYGGGHGAGGFGIDGGDGGQITIAGNAVVFATSNQAAQIGGGPGGNDGTKTLMQGVVFEGNAGKVYGSPELPRDMIVSNGFTLTVPDGSTLTIPNNTTVTNDGTIENYGKVNGDGAITNNGTINDHSNGITVAVTGRGVNKASEVMITFWKEGQELADARALTGDTLTVQAKVAQKRVRLRSAAPDQVIFKTGNTELGAVSVINGTATISITLTETAWTPGRHTITAEYGGSAGMLPNDTGSAVLIVEALSYTITASPENLDFGSKLVNDTEAPDAKAVMVKNTGNSPISGYTVSGSVNYDVIYTSGAIPVGGSAAFTVRPKTGLAANTYKETLTITTTEGSKATIDVSFTVEIVKPTGGSGGSGGGGSSYTNPNILHGTWTRTDAGVWMFRLTSASYATSRWGQIDGQWYYFDHEGKMLTGWQLLNNRWYYLCTEAAAKLEADKKEGAMLTGWYFDPAYQSWFYLDASGAMVTGWKEISGKWYYFYGNGAMAVNAEVAGYKLGPDGAWIQ